MKDLTIFEPKYRTLVGYLRQDEPKTLSNILFDVSIRTNVSIEAIKSHTRKREIAEARNIFCKAARVQGISFRKIGEYVGIKHSTVIHGCHNVDFIPSLQKKYRELYAE